MDKDDRVDDMLKGVDQVLRHLAEGGVGATVGPDGVRLGMPNWEEATKHLRPSERVKTHGYPLGFAKSQWMLRDRAIVQLRQRVAGTSPEEHGQHAAHEAVARALDWERLLGSFNHAEEDHFPVSAVDQVASNVLAWMDHQGFRVVPKEDDQVEPQRLPGLESALPNIFDNARRLVVLVRPQEEPRLMSAAPENDGDDWEDEEEEDEDEIRLADGESICPVCKGVGEIGRAPFEQECGGCAGERKVGQDRLAELGTSGEWVGDWTPHYSTYSAAANASDCPWGRPLREVYIKSFEDMDSELGLDDLNLRGRDLTGVDFSWIDFSGAEIRDANLSNATLDEADLSSVDLSGVILTGASFSSANLTGVDLRGRDLNGANFRGANLSNAVLAGASLRGATLEGADLSNADFRDAELSDSDLHTASSLKGTNLGGAVGLRDEQRTACEVLGARFA